MQRLLLSLFPGAGLMDAGFQRAGYTVVRGPDLMLGQDIRTWTAPPEAASSDTFEGIIGGPPCQDFSRARRRPPTGYGRAMLKEFIRCVTDWRPQWWLLENVPGIPTVTIADYTTQRFNVGAAAAGLAHRRLRSLQFGYRSGPPVRPPVSTQSHSPRLAATPLASDSHRKLSRVLSLMGLPAQYDLPGLTPPAKRRAIANGLPVPVAAAVAAAIRDRYDAPPARLCACGCGAQIPDNPRALTASAACRTRLSRRRRAGAPLVLAWPATDAPTIHSPPPLPKRD